MDGLLPFAERKAPEGFTLLDLQRRWLLQAMYFVEQTRRSIESEEVLLKTRSSTDATPVE